MIIFIFQFSTYMLALYIIFLAISKPQKGLLLYLATQTTRFHNFYNVPRILSPQTFDLIILLILLYGFNRYINIKHSIKSSKIFLLWVISHILFRYIHYIVYPNMSFVTVTSDIIGFYFKIYILYLIIIGYLNQTNQFNSLNKALLTNLTIFCGFIYLEYFFHISYHSLYQTIFYSGGEMTGNALTLRGGSPVLIGPMSHWVGTGTYLVSCLSIIFYYHLNKANTKTLMVLILFLFTIFIVGARSAMVSACCVLAFYFMFNSKKHKIIINFLLISFLISLFMLSPYFQYLIDSFSVTEQQGVNFYRRLLIQIFMVEFLMDTPLIGYAESGIKNTKQVLFQFHDLMEINFIFKEILDFGIIIASITIIFYVVIFKNIISFKYPWKNIATYSWLGILICYISNGNQEYLYYTIPIIFYSYTVWQKQNTIVMKKV